MAAIGISPVAMRSRVDASPHCIDGSRTIHEHDPLLTEPIVPSRSVGTLCVPYDGQMLDPRQPEPGCTEGRGKIEAKGSMHQISGRRRLH